MTTIIPGSKIIICAAASLRVAAKIAAGFVEGLDRIADTLFALLLPGERFWLQRGPRK
jgi:hypothetical protein